MAETNIERPVRMYPAPKELQTTEAWNNAIAIFKEMRKTKPISYDPDRKSWDILKYDDIMRVLKDPEVFSSRIERTGGGFEEIIKQQPPRHRYWRELQERSFTVHHLRKLQPRIYQIVEELVDGAIERGVLRISYDIGDILPTMVMADMVGVNQGDWRQLRAWTREWLRVPQDENGDYTPSEEAFKETMRKKLETLAQMHAFFRELVEDRKKSPKDDLLTRIWFNNEELGEEKIPYEHLIHHIAFLFAAGSDTTNGMITNGVRVLSERPDIVDRLAADPSISGPFVEEVLRYHPNVAVLPRLIAKDVEFNGFQMKAGDFAQCWFLSGNHDEDHFPNADEFIPDRKPNVHFGFGGGPHYCMGAPLARMEGQAVFETVSRKMKNIRRIPGEKYEVTAQPVWTMKEVAVHFDLREG